MIKLKTKKVRRHLYATEFKGEHIDFWKQLSTGLWFTNYFDDQRGFTTMKSAKRVVEKELTEKVRWLAKTDFSNKEIQTLLETHLVSMAESLRDLGIEVSVSLRHDANRAEAEVIAYLSDEGEAA